MTGKEGGVGFKVEVWTEKSVRFEAEEWTSLLEILTRILSLGVLS